MSYRLTLVEAQDLMRTATGESWSLPRLIDAGARVAVWLEPPPNASRAVIDAVFMGSKAGFVAQVVEGSDLQGLAFKRGDGTLTFARRPDGQVVRMSTPARFGADDVRFDADDLRALADRVGVAPGPAPAKTPASWVEQARLRAEEIKAAAAKSDRYPNQIDMADQIAREWRPNGPFAENGKPLTGATIKRYGLLGIFSAKAKLKQTSKKRGE